MEELKVEPHGGQLWLEWKSHNSKAVSEYVVEWVNADQTDWQREKRSTRRTVIKGNILSEPYFLWNKWFSVCVCMCGGGVGSLRGGLLIDSCMTGC